MRSFWKLRKALGMRFDLIEAYGEVLEKHPGPIECSSLLPAPKDELRRVLLTEAKASGLKGRSEYVDVILRAFVCLAQFQSGAERAIRASREMVRLSAIPSEAALDRMANIDMAEYERVSGQIRREQEALATEWSREFSSLAASLEMQSQQRAV